MNKKKLKKNEILEYQYKTKNIVNFVQNIGDPHDGEMQSNEITDNTTVIWCRYICWLEGRATSIFMVCEVFSHTHPENKI